MGWKWNGNIRWCMKSFWLKATFLQTCKTLGKYHFSSKQSFSISHFLLYIIREISNKTRLTEVGDISRHIKRNLSYKMADWRFSHLLSAVWRRIWPSDQCTSQFHIKLLQLKEGRSNLHQTLHPWAKARQHSNIQITPRLQLFCSPLRTSILIHQVKLA